MEKLNEQSETGCCPRFDPESWQEKEITMDEKLFVKDHVCCFLHIPLNFGRKMRKNMNMIEQADALAPDMLVLSDDKSLWWSDLYISVSKEVPEAEMARIPGTFMTMVFEGPYRNAAKWAKEMKDHVESKGKEIKKLLFFYTTCPKCAKVYGKNYTVLLAEV